jgi:nucleotide-binding universal stress UspA family protein
MLPPVLVPRDGLPESDRALGALGRLAVDPGDMILLDVLPRVEPLSPASSSLAGDGPAWATAGVAALEAATRTAAADDARIATLEIAGNDPVVDILVAAKRHGCGMIAMTMPDGDHPLRITLDSLAGQVVAASAVPVLLAPRRPADRPDAPITRVLVPLDGSAAAEAALPAAVETADRLRAELHLAEVVDATGFTSPLGGRLLPEVQERLRNGLCDQASHYLRRVAEERMRPGRFITWSVLEGAPPAMIAREAGPDDLVVTAVRMGQRAADWHAGGLIESMARESRSLLLLVPSGS